MSHLLAKPCAKRVELDTASTTAVKISFVLFFIGGILVND